jgi:hypothetical protein
MTPASSGGIRPVSHRPDRWPVPRSAISLVGKIAQFRGREMAPSRWTGVIPIAPDETPSPDAQPDDRPSSGSSLRPSRQRVGRPLRLPAQAGHLRGGGRQAARLRLRQA